MSYGKKLWNTKEVLTIKIKKVEGYLTHRHYKIRETFFIIKFEKVGVCILDITYEIWETFLQQKLRKSGLYHRYKLWNAGDVLMIKIKHMGGGCVIDRNYEIRETFLR